MKPGYRKKTTHVYIGADDTGFINKNQAGELIRELATTQEFYEIEPARVVKVNLNPFDEEFPILSNGSPDYSALGTIYVQLMYSQKGTGKRLDALVKPISPHIVQYPMIGEIVNVAEYHNQLYYHNPLNSNARVTSNSDIETDGNIFYPLIKHNRRIFPNHGDTIFQGRFGQSIQFSSDENKVQPNIKIVNGQIGDNEESKLNQAKQINETFPHGTNINNDNSSIYMTLNEHVPLKTGFKSLAKGPNTIFNQPMHSNIVLNADSLIFNAKKKKINMFAPTQIAVSSNIVTLEVGEGKVELGNVGANNAVVGENELETLLTDFATDLSEIIGDVISECQSIVTRLPLPVPEGKTEADDIGILERRFDAVADKTTSKLNKFSETIKNYFKDSNVFMAPKSKLDGNVEWEKK